MRTPVPCLVSPIHLRCPQPYITGLGIFAAGSKGDSVLLACRPAYAAAKAAQRIDMDFVKHMRVEHPAELALTDTGFAADTAVPVNPGDILGSKEGGGASLLDIIFVCHTIAVAVADT